jgi:hypothetical protein
MFYTHFELLSLFVQRIVVPIGMLWNYGATGFGIWIFCFYAVYWVAEKAGLEPLNALDEFFLLDS